MLAVIISPVEPGQFILGPVWKATVLYAGAGSTLFTLRSNWVGARLLTRLSMLSALSQWNVPEKFLKLNLYVHNPFLPLTYFIISD